MIGYTLRKSSAGIVLFIVVLLLAGCLGRSSPKVTYYSLLTKNQLGDVQSVASLPDVKLGIGPITIPDSLKRSQVATRQHGNQYEFAEFHRWAGVLERDLTAVIGDNLGHLLGVERIGVFPWMAYFEPSYRVIIDITRLDGAIDGEAVLSARWAVTNTDGKEVLINKKSDYNQPLEDASYASLIKAESKLVAKLSKDIAEEIIALQK